MKKRRIKWKNIIILFLFLIFLVIFIISLTNIIKWKKDSNKINDQVKKTQEIVNIEKGNKKNEQIVEQNDIPSSNPYWDYIKMNLINVDFAELKKINPEVKGWIQVKGTNINYPFVQTNDNKYYLTHAFDKSHNSAGWVFIDYRNKLNGTDKNTIIYAHGRLDKTMFGSLKNILTSGWLDNKNNFVVKLSTKYENTLWQVFSVYHIPTTSDYIRTDFNGDKDFLNLANKLLNRSSYDFNTTVSENDRILTLSTCYNDSEKVVLHAKLIKFKKK